MQPTPLINDLAKQIAEHLRAENPPAGTRLVERKLAEQFRVSRSPIRSALRLLHAQGVLGLAGSGGFITIDGRQASWPDHGATVTNEEAMYLRIAQDRLEGVLPERVTENELQRRYNMTRGELARLLRRILSEGWIERLPGHGWTFLPMLTSIESYKDSYRFRLVIEPAAILEPGFVLDRIALEACREEQQRLVDGQIWSVSSPALFDMNSKVHETIIECSRNSCLIDGLKRVDRLRRLMEYKQSLDRRYAIVRCREHVELIDLLLEERRQDASEFMRRHLSSVSVEKVINKVGAAQGISSADD
ncbi:GntR family transcriptional regulator [Bradyrhizobium sp. 179]|uniref:GntR family transcriptional regulator n=1 Tax=Bradyrhizobium sp. 179 TaxID=2782648 RepID=UPI001FF99BAB|nr:GntR family transcriptional regulator [Bradyrhizobium sp. 179]MCK1541149.1 GntR family transcriptional regulator [Bradyrhizobium sp. 179]